MIIASFIAGLFMGVCVMAIVSAAKEPECGCGRGPLEDAGPRDTIGSGP